MRPEDVDASMTVHLHGEDCDIELDGDNTERVIMLAFLVNGISRKNHIRSSTLLEIVKHLEDVIAMASWFKTAIPYASLRQYVEEMTAAETKRRKN